MRRKRKSLSRDMPLAPDQRPISLSPFEAACNGDGRH
jgi:hypothetical protein